MRVDQKRYLDKVKEALRKKLPEIVSGKSILGAPPGSKYRIRLPYLEVPYLRPENPAGAGGGGGSGPGEGGEGEGELYIELTTDDIIDLIFDSLQLPLLPKGHELETEAPRVEGVSKDGLPQRIHWRKTIIEAQKHGAWWPGVLRYRDLRKSVERRYAAVVVFARDSSGSMDEERRYLVRAASLWIFLWLKRVYPQVVTHFIVHDTRAQEVKEEEFFSAHIGGGTYVSTAWVKAEEILQDYDAQSWNRYIFYFSDGENFYSDNPTLEIVLKKLIPTLELAAYGEVGEGYDSLIELMTRFGVRSAKIRNRGEVGVWLRKIFSDEFGEEKVT